MEQVNLAITNTIESIKEAGMSTVLHFAPAAIIALIIYFILCKFIGRLATNALLVGSALIFNEELGVMMQSVFIYFNNQF
ncbi:hypothetical protein [Domibacillus enclensis]|uniref:Uncharacterized protein n=1 Tax=Domibacillus enclensis TaxID=1017273 RepID=A0A1N6WI77_9BACI|nr:hypothetical protein [Domibacillus enclensis]OXS77943.1 hypothetical protein B1B05_10075 [Domibacillus enclensis]SIQ89813.1 hypothetical protein SAMN05443094_104176 [Domibacillus enclensis]